MLGEKKPVFPRWRRVASYCDAVSTCPHTETCRSRRTCIAERTSRQTKVREGFWANGHLVSIGISDLLEFVVAPDRSAGCVVVVFRANRSAICIRRVFYGSNAYGAEDSAPYVA
jgi:hypothetical protein